MSRTVSYEKKKGIDQFGNLAQRSSIDDEINKMKAISLNVLDFPGKN
ncbi:MAG: hypothetical protein Ct9H300mP9_1190 [Candidatus Neomarinimicrobiota bacterium]|nr:MAG: hypothetical protein Ct9H300mP9_1190 [Candidatus Neomarinimicrobiota bacterium]